MRPTALAILLAAAGVATLPPALAGAACPAESVPAPSLSTDQYEQTLLCLVNERRAEAGRGSLETQSHLARAARRHAEAMVSRGFFSHRSPTGRTPADRVEASGYPRGTKRWLYGENLAWGYGGMGTPLSIVEGWVNSPPHRENLLRGRFRDLGVAVVTGAPGPTAYPGAVTVVNVYGYRR